ncbi:MAG: hypothetical protein ACOC97_03170 [Myxococcota bacterium]
MGALRGWLVAFGTALLLGACPRPTPISERHRIDIDESHADMPLTVRLLVLADNQQHHLYGEPVWIQSGLPDRLVRTAVRSPQLDLFGPDVLAWGLRANRRAPAVHLGDACNLSCTGELDRFLQIIDDHDRGWFMAPGNHDGFYFGNEGIEPEGDWARVCRGAGQPLTKDAFVRRYLEALAAQDLPGTSAFRHEADLGARRGQWRYLGDERALLRRVAWSIDPALPHRSFVLQMLDIGFPTATVPTFVLLLDSASYPFAPELFPLARNAGMVGHLVEEQLDIAERWLDDVDDAGAPIVLMAHHPYDDLKRPAKRAVDRFRRKHRVLTYVSAHTHDGGFRVHPGDDESWVELNVGSMVDWPIEYRTLQLFSSRESEERVLLRSPLFRIGQMWRDASATDVPRCEEPWKAVGNHYVSYGELGGLDAHAMKRRLMESLLETFDHLLQAVPSHPDNPVWPDGTEGDEAVRARIAQALEEGDVGPMVALARQLDDFDRARQAADPRQQADFRLCQAMWASQDDQVGARRPRVDDWYIQLPRNPE